MFKGIVKQDRKVTLSTLKMVFHVSLIIHQM